MKLMILILILLLFMNIQNVWAEENEYGTVNAWFNEKNASIETIDHVQLKIGEPVKIKIEVISRINGHIYIELEEPGITRSYDVSEGPGGFGDVIDNYNVTTVWSKSFTWTLVPNGAWKNGNAPINIFVQFDNIENGKKRGVKDLKFTIANPYILDEEYPVQKPSLQTSTISTPTKSAPFIPVFLAAIAVLAARRRR